MRFSLTLASTLAGTLFASSAIAHDGHHPIAGEEPLEPSTATEALLDLLVPEAEAAANFKVEGKYRYIAANGYPYKSPGRFPNRNNPHSISKKNYQLKVPANPRKGRARSADGTPFGIALNGVLFDPATAEFWQNNRRSGWNYEANSKACKLGLDKHSAHVQPDGTYHYHGIPTGLLSSAGGRSTPALIGYAADGFPIYGPYGYSNPKQKSSLKKLSSSFRIKSGTRPSGPGGRYNGTFTQDWAYVAGSGDLDQCNGRFAVTPEYPNGTYHYVITESFPYIPRCWMGAPDMSFARLKSRGGNGRGDIESKPTDTDILPANYLTDKETPVIDAQHRPPPRGAGQRPPRGERNARQGGGGRSPCSGN